MNSCLRSNLLTAVSFLLIASGIADKAVSTFQVQNDILQARVAKLVDQSREDYQSASAAQQAAAEAHRAAVDELNEKKRQLEAKGCKL